MAKNKYAGKNVYSAFYEKKRKLSPNMIAIIITAAILVVTLLTVGIIFLVNAIKKDKWFDYVKSNITKYIELPEEAYKNYELELSIARPHAIDVDVAILNLISSEDYRTLVGEGGSNTSIAVTAGDKLVVRYRGYTLDENGEEKVISTAMSNITYATGTTLQIGDSNSTLPIGFELGLIGKVPNDYAKFEKITSGKAKDHAKGDDWVIYVSAERIPVASIGDSEKEKSDTVKFSSMRIDLSDKEEVEKYFGVGFVETVKTYNIGQEYSFTAKIGSNNTEYKYKTLKIDFATTCEKAKTSENGKAPLRVEGYFAYDYGIEGTATAGLRNKTVYYDVFIEELIPYDTTINGVKVNSPAELTDDVVLYLVNQKDSEIGETELRAYEGETLVQKYRNYVVDYLDEAYEEAKKIMIENALWNRLLDKAKVIKYPISKVEEIHKEYIDDVYYQYDFNGGSLQDSEGNFTSYNTLDEFAVAYLKLEEGADWQAALYTMSESLVKERLILFYILQVEEMMPSDDELEAEISAIKQEYLDEYLKQYIQYKEYNDESFSADDFTEESYKTFVEDRKKELFDYYDDDYFEETAYYEYALRKLIVIPTVYTLDNPKPAATE